MSYFMPGNTTQQNKFDNFIPIDLDGTPPGVARCHPLCVVLLFLLNESHDRFLKIYP